MFKQLKILSLLISTLIWSCPTVAALEWANASGGAGSADGGDVYKVLEYTYFNNPNDTTMMVVQVKVEGAVTGTNCGPSNSSTPAGSSAPIAYFAQWGTSTSNFMMKLVDAVSMAMATDGRIKIEYKDSECAPNYGAKMEGFRFIPADN